MHFKCTKTKQDYRNRMQILKKTSTPAKQKRNFTTTGSNNNHYTIRNLCDTNSNRDRDYKTRFSDIQILNSNRPNSTQRHNPRRFFCRSSHKGSAVSLHNGRTHDRYWRRLLRTTYWVFRFLDVRDNHKLPWLFVQQPRL